MEYTASPIDDKIMESAVTAEDACEEEACSICLEPFTGEDPATVTNCKHEYHLQCILDWSQRSKECPICWQLLVLKDPASQELLAAVEIERNSRSRRRSSNTSSFPRVPYEDIGFDHVSPYSDDSDFDERIMQHLAVAMGRARHFSRRERHRSSGLGSSQFLVFASPENGSLTQQTNVTAPIENQTSSSVSSMNNSPVSSMNNSPTIIVSSPVNSQSPSSMLSPHVNTMPNIADSSQGPSRPRVLTSQVPPDSPRRTRPSEFLSFSESLKSKWSAASARYKESISKGTRGFKEKILARNSVKELSKEVQREVTAGIAGVARMMERLDPTSKRTGGSDPISSDTGGTSGVQENHSDRLHNDDDGEPANGSNSATPVPVRLEASHVQDTR